jgi:hypothetical protein
VSYIHNNAIIDYARVVVHIHTYKTGVYLSQTNVLAVLTFAGKPIHKQRTRFVSLFEPGVYRSRTVPPGMTGAVSWPLGLGVCKVDGLEKS